MKSRFSIQKRIFGAMLLISMIPIILLAYFSLNISQSNMRRQLIQNRMLGIEWLNDKLTTELNDYADIFYENEVDRVIKNGLVSWALGSPMKSEALDRIRGNFEEALNADAKIRSIELYNAVTGEGYIATRESFRTGSWEELEEIWRLRSTDLQTNIVVMRENEDFLVMHQMNEFTTGKPCAMLVIRLNKQAFTKAIEKDLEQGGDAVLYNDAGELLAWVGQNTENLTGEDLAGIREKMQGEPTAVVEQKGSFFFYETINKGKLSLLYIVPYRLISGQLKDTVEIAVIIMLCSLAAAVLLSILFSEIISKPIIGLSRKMQTTDIHNFSAETPIRRRDEIGLLQESFERMMERNQELVAREYQSEIEKKNAQLQALQAQINPHFLYNTLQVIGGMSVTGRGEEIYPVVTALGDILRYAMGFSQEMVTLEQEITYLQSYISIQNSRFDNRLQFETEISGAAARAYIPKLILQPLVENCLEHGLARKGGEWHIRLEACEEPETDVLIIRVSDNGTGMEEEQLEELRSILERDGRDALSSSAHIGLRNVNARVRMRSGPGYGVEMQSSREEGTTITIRTRLIWEV